MAFDLRAAQEAVSDRYEARVATLLRNGMDAMVSGYALSDMVAVPLEFREDAKALLSEMWRASAAGSGAALIDEFRGYAWPVETKADDEDLWDRIVADFVERFGAVKVQQIVETTRVQLMEIVRDGQGRGLTLEQIAREMRDAVPELARLRSHVIARTETHSSSMFAAQAVAKTARRPLMKEWVSVEDGRVRSTVEGDAFSHLQMNGIRIPMNEPYMVPTKFGTREPLMFPGDPNGSPGNVIMCRCVETYHRSE